MDNLNVELTPLQAAMLTQVAVEAMMVFGVQRGLNAVSNAIAALDDQLEALAERQGLTLEQLLKRLLMNGADEEPSAALLHRAERAKEDVQTKRNQAAHDREVAEADRERVNEAMGPGFQTIL